MKLNTSHLRYLTPEDWRVLAAVQRQQVEQGSKNHEIVPTPLIIKLSHLRSGSGAHKSISTLAKANLIARVQNAKYDGYRLTYGGLDYLALHTHFQRKTLHSTGQCIGTGKESDIHIVLAPPLPPPHHQKHQCILKIHRLGRISFRTIKTNRDYLRHRSSASWMHMSRLSALKEYTFMTALHEAGFPVPTPMACNRHTVVMSLVEGTPLYQIRHLEEQEARRLYAELMAMIVRLAGVGLIHGDFNEFNIIIEERDSPSSQTINDPPADLVEKLEHGESGEQDTTANITLHPILIDFPQMLSISHPNASTYFDRDVHCIKRYFSRRFHFASDDPGPLFEDVETELKKSKGIRRMDVEVEASGFSRKMAKELEKYMEDVGVDRANDDVESASDGSRDSDAPDNTPHGTHDDARAWVTSTGSTADCSVDLGKVELGLAANQGSSLDSPMGATTVFSQISIAEAS
ncbi:MAG: hypothetical protein Q9215_003804 [Flavoplaca cf. flavocitrina]